MRLWTDCGAFFRAFRRNFHTTGAILPSSRFLARAMTFDLKGPRRPARILEVGPGTGAVTREIVRHLQDDDRFDAVEINPSFDPDDRSARWAALAVWRFLVGLATRRRG